VSLSLPFRAFTLALLLLVHISLSTLPALPRATTLLRKKWAPARHAYLLYGEVRTLREGLTSQLKLLEGSAGGLDIYAVLSPTTKHMVRPGVAPNAASDEVELAWLRAQPNLRALQLLEVGHHLKFIEAHLPLFPWSNRTFWEYILKPANVVASFLKRRLVWQLMEETLRAAGAPGHRYDTLVVGRGDIRVHPEQWRWYHGIDLDDFSLTGRMRGNDAFTAGLLLQEFVPGQPDSWAPMESAERARRPMPNIFVNSFRIYGGVVKSDDMFAVGDYTAVSYYCNALDFMEKLCNEEKGGPSNASPVELDPGNLLGMGIISAAREATRRARETDVGAPPHGVRFTELRIHLCLGQENRPYSLENGLSGCFGS
jgi:hypothetical protein